MKITALQEYGIRCTLQLAKGGMDIPLTANTIAEKEGLSKDNVEKILFQLIFSRLKKNEKIVLHRFL